MTRSSPGIELLPCPFCGETDVGFGRTGQKWQTVACNECGAEGPCTEIDRDLIVQKWNARALQPATTTAGQVWCEPCGHHVMPEQIAECCAEPCALATAGDAVAGEAKELDFSDPQTDAIMGAVRSHTHDHTSAYEITQSVLAALRSPDAAATLKHYAEQYCEGWCKDSPPSASFDDCGGCRARLALAQRGNVAQSVTEPSDEWCNAFLKATGEWIEPHEPETECGVPMECEITQEFADELNADARKQIRKGYAAACSISSTDRASSAKDTFVHASTPDALKVTVITSTPRGTLTIDDVPSCGQENDHRRAIPSPQDQTS
jgi:Lar family restriction alleviation protein